LLDEDIDDFEGDYHLPIPYSYNLDYYVFSINVPAYVIFCFDNQYIQKPFGKDWIDL